MSDHVEFVVDKTALGQVFSEYFSFLCQSFHQLLHTNHQQSSRTGTMGQIVAILPSDSISPHPKKEVSHEL
jgi:hypothetical protein